MAEQEPSILNFTRSHVLANLSNNWINYSSSWILLIP